MDNQVITVGEFHRQHSNLLLYLLIVLFACTTLCSLFIAVRNAKPVCQTVVQQTVGYTRSNVCQYDLGDHYNSNDYIQAESN